MNKKHPNPKTIKVTGTLWVVEGVLVVGILFARFVFHWF